MKTGLTGEAVKKTETLKTIYERRAVRKYKDKPVNIATIEQILDAARMAPSAINKQPWKFYILTNKETIKSFSKEIGKVAAKHIVKADPKQIIKTVVNLLHFPYVSDLSKNRDAIFHGAPVVNFITAPRDDEWEGLDIGMCAQNLMLAAKSLGLDSCPVGLGKYVEQTNSFSKLRIPSSDQVYIAIIMGYGNETAEVHKRIRNNAIFIDLVESW